MRELRFRIWSGERFYYWGFVREQSTKKNLLVFTNPPQLSKPLSMEELQDRSQQFTGQEDKDGKEIYEGDILKAIWGEGEEDIFEVFWEDTGWWGKDKKSHYSFGDYHTFEVIGNKFENPELLKNGDKRT